MGISQDINWSEALQNVGIMASLLLAVYSALKEAEARRISNLNAVTDRHREIWNDSYDRDKHSRVLKADADLNEDPLSIEEEAFVTELILHLGSVHFAGKAGMFVALEGLPLDIRTFFSLPIPKAVWEKWKPFQNRDFVEFVEEALL